MRRITMKALQERVDMLNRMANLSDNVWHDGKMVPGMFVLDAAYGGYRLCQIVNHGGGERSLTGRAGARDTYELINAFIDGYQFGKNCRESAFQANHAATMAFNRAIGRG